MTSSFRRSLVPTIALALALLANNICVRGDEAAAPAAQVKLDEDNVDNQKAGEQQAVVVPEKPKPRLAVVIPFNGVIDAGLEQFFERKLDEAQKAGADVVILEIDS